MTAYTQPGLLLAHLFRKWRPLWAWQRRHGKVSGYSGYLNTNQLNTVNIWIPKFLKLGFQMVLFSNGRSMCYPMYWPTIQIPDQYIQKHDGVHLSIIQMVRLSSIQRAFYYRTVWHPTSFWPFEYRTSLVFRSHGTQTSLWSGNPISNTVGICNLDQSGFWMIKRCWFANALDFERNLYRCPTIWNPDQWLPFCQTIW